MKPETYLKLAALCCILVGSFFAVPKIREYIMETKANKNLIQLARSNSGYESINGAEIDFLKEAKSSQPVRLAFFGDMMFDRSIRQVIDKKSISYLFEKSERLLAESDINIANLEGPIADRASVSVNTKPEDKGHFTFVFDPDILQHLKKLRFDAVNIGNNHILNFGNSGLSETETYLAQNDIEYFGSPGEESISLTQNIKGRKIALIGYNQFNGTAKQGITENISAARKDSDLVIVYAHWGEEYKTTPNAAQIQLAHNWIDAGADAVIGSHPHVVQNIEQYKGKYIFYSLGNFVFDQYFSKNTMEGLGVLLDFTGPSQLEYRLVPISIKPSGQIEPMAITSAKIILAGLSDKAIVPQETKELISAGNIR